MKHTVEVSTRNSYGGRQHIATVQVDAPNEDAALDSVIASVGLEGVTLKADTSYTLKCGEVLTTRFGDEFSGPARATDGSTFVEPEPSVEPTMDDAEYRADMMPKRELNSESFKKALEVFKNAGREKPAMTPQELEKHMRDTFGSNAPGTAPADELPWDRSDATPVEDVRRAAKKIRDGSYGFATGGPIPIMPSFLPERSFVGDIVFPKQIGGPPARMLGTPGVQSRYVYYANGRDSYGDPHSTCAGTQAEADQLLRDKIFRADVDGQPATD